MIKGHDCSKCEEVTGGKIYKNFNQDIVVVMVEAKEWSREDHYKLVYIKVRYQMITFLL